jgi:hypothetical protein
MNTVRLWTQRIVFQEAHKVITLQQESLILKIASILPYSTSDFSNSSNCTTDSEDEVDSTTSYKRSNRTFTPPYIIGALTTIYLGIVIYGYLNPL